jgi:hypothetical protein
VEIQNHDDCYIVIPETAVEMKFYKTARGRKKCIAVLKCYMEHYEKLDNWEAAGNIDHAISYIQLEGLGIDPDTRH